MACRQVKRAGLASNPDICTCKTTVAKKCDTHKGVKPACGHIGCVDCRADDWCCDAVVRGKRHPGLPEHIDRSEMRG